MLSEVFYPGDVKRILSSPPSLSLQDSYYWAYSKDGVYSLKIGNWLVSNEDDAELVFLPAIKATNDLKSHV